MKEYNKEFWQAAAIRSVRTICQTALATLTAASVSDYINWGTVLSSALLAGLYSLLTSIGTGLPETKTGLPETKTGLPETKTDE